MTSKVQTNKNNLVANKFIVLLKHETKNQMFKLILGNLNFCELYADVD